MKDELLELLRPFGQQHLLAFWDELDPRQRGGLADQIRALDLQQIATLYQECETEEDLAKLAASAGPPPAVRIGGADNPFTAEQARVRGRQALSAGTVGVALVAGGQGTRLGFDHPKGMYAIGPVSDASLFQILIEKIVATADRYQTRIPLYLMTSPATHKETLAYMDRVERFGLAPEELFVFCQGTLPAVDAATGRLLLSDRHQLSQSPDGHGGMLAALEKSGALRDMSQRRLDQLFYFQVDNPLATVCDPELIGYHLLARSEYTLQVVAKQSPIEKVGNVVQTEGGTRVIEYSDLSDEAAGQRTEDGSLKLWAGSIAVHVFDIDFLSRMAKSESSIPFHRAAKKVSYIDSTGSRVEPADPNAIKFERFIFDLLPKAARTLSVEVDPKVGFAPLKNAAGAAFDTVEHVHQQMLDYFRRMVDEAGCKVSENVRVEISPKFALDVEQLKSKIASGTLFEEDVYLK